MKDSLILFAVFFGVTGFCTNLYVNSTEISNNQEDLAFTALWFARTRVTIKQLFENETDNKYKTSFEVGKDDVLEWKYKNSYLYYYVKERIMEMVYKYKDEPIYTIINMKSLKAHVIYKNEMIALNAFKNRRTGEWEDFTKNLKLLVNKNKTYEFVNGEVKYGKHGNEIWLKNSIVNLRIYNINYDLHDWTVEGRVQFDPTEKFIFQMKKNMFKLNSSLNLITVEFFTIRDRAVAFVFPFNDQLTAKFRSYNRLNITYNPITKNYRVDSFDSNNGEWLNTINMNSKQIKLIGKKSLYITDNITSIEMPKLDVFKITGPKGKLTIRDNSKKITHVNCANSSNIVSNLYTETQMKPGNFAIEYNLLSGLTNFTIDGIFGNSKYDFSSSFIDESLLWSSNAILATHCEKDLHADIKNHQVITNNGAHVRHYDISINPNLNGKIVATYYNNDFKEINSYIKVNAEYTILTIS